MQRRWCYTLSCCVKQAVAPSEASSGYGYLWWLFDDAYACRGFGGQEVKVYPDEKIVTIVKATPTQRSKEYPDISEQILENLL